MKVDLTNKYIFWLIIAFVVILLTAINNYYFYDYMKVLSKRDSAKLGQQLKLTVKDCQDNNISNEVCEDFLVDYINHWSKKTIYNRSLYLTTMNSEVTALRDSSKYTSAIGSDININTKLLLTSNSTGYVDKSLKENVSLIQLLPTVYRSVTLSIEDVYKSFTKEIKATANGIVISSDTKYITVKYTNKEIIKYRYYKHDKLYIKTADVIKKDQLLITGNIHTAINTFIHFIPRSRPFLGYLFIVFILLTIFKKREEAYKKSIEKIEKEKKDAQEKYEEEIRKINLKDAEKLSTASKIKEEEDQICSGFNRFDSILNPPVNTINIKELLDSNVNFAGTAFRQVLEKIIFTIHDKKIAIDNPKRTLASAIFDLEKQGIITKKISQTLHAVRIYGNDNTHYTNKSSTKIEALVAAMNLLTIMEEIEKMYLEVNKEKTKQSGLRIVKKADKE